MRPPISYLSRKPRVRTAVSLEPAIRAIDRETEAVVLGTGRYGYNEARSLFNSSLDRKPSAVVRVRRTVDVARIVQILSQAQLPFTVRGGGHSIAGTSIQDGAVVLDLSLLRKVKYDLDLGVASAEAGALWCDYDEITSQFGRASTGGIVSHTGVAGLTLGGGLGWLMGEFGLACDRLIGLTVVDARGESCDIREDQEALKYFRGSGRSLGVVTSLHFRPNPIPANVTSGRMTWNSSEWPNIMRNCSIAAADSPDWLTVSPSLLWADGKWCAVLDFVSTRNVADTREALLAQYGATPSLVEETPYKVAQTKLDSEFRFGRRNYWKSVALSNVDDMLAKGLVEHIERSPSRQTFISVDVLHGQALVDPVGGSSYRLRDRPLVILLNTIWEDPRQDEENIRWCSEGFDLLVGGAEDDSTYSNYFSEDDVGVQSGSEQTLPPEIIARWKPSGLR